MTLREHPRYTFALIQGGSGDSSAGYVKAYRTLQDHPKLGPRSPACERWAWLDLIMLAAWEPHFTMIKRESILVDRGDVVASVRFLMKRWRWGANKTHEFIKLLISQQMINKKKNGSGNGSPTVFSIVNYDIYQSHGAESGTVSGTGRGTVAERLRNETKKGKKLKKETTVNNLPPSEARPVLLPEDAVAVEAGAVEVPRVGSARPAGVAHVVATTLGAIDPAPKGQVLRFEYPEDFETLWNALPEKAKDCGKKAAFSSWKTALKSGATVDEIMTGLGRWKASRRWADGYITYVTTWLNQERWKVQPEAAPAEGSTPSPAQPLLAEFGRLYEAKVTYAYVGNTDRDLKILEELLAQRNGRGESAFPPATLQRLMKGFFKYPPQWAREKDRFDIPMFKASFPELTRMLERNDI